MSWIRHALTQAAGVSDPIHRDASADSGRTVEGRTRNTYLASSGNDKPDVGLSDKQTTMT